MILKRNAWLWGLLLLLALAWAEHDGSSEIDRDMNHRIDINHLYGSADDPDSRIWPLTRMHILQPYDKGRSTLVYMHLRGDDEDAFWGNYDFGRAIRTAILSSLGTLALILPWVFAIFWHLTTGGSFTHHVKPVITGFDQVELPPRKKPTWNAMNRAGYANGF